MVHTVINDTKNITATKQFLLRIRHSGRNNAVIPCTKCFINKCFPESNSINAEQQSGNIAIVIIL